MPTGTLAAVHRGGVSGEAQTAAEPYHRLLLQRMEPLFRPPADPPTERRLTRLLVKVTVDRSLWPVHLVLDAGATVADLVRAAVAAYVREGRRPPLEETDAGADGFELHLNKYALESLSPDERVLDLGSRDFFLCARRSGSAAAVS